MSFVTDMLFGADAPPAPDYRAAAEQTAQGNFENLLWQTFANRPNQVTPWGSSSWSYGPAAGGQQPRPAPAPGPRAPSPSTPTARPSGGSPQSPYYGGFSPENDSFTPAPPRSPGAPAPAPRAPGTQPAGPGGFSPNNPQQWTQTIALDPRLQAALDSQLRVQTGRSQGAEGLLRQATGNFQSPMNWSGLPRGASRLGDASDYRDRAQAAVEKLQRPDLDRRRAAVQTQLANQGITQGSEAWKTAMEDVNDAESRAQLMAIGEGRNEAGFMNTTDINTGQFNNLNRQQYLAEALTRRGQPLNELNALLNGQQVQSPQMPSYTPAGRTDGPNYSGAAQQQYGATADIFNYNNARNNSMTNAAINAGMMMFSDIRLKKDIVYLFTLENGIKVYKYRMLGKDAPELGVIAQEVQQIMPDAVAVDASGLLKVDYSKVLA
jgi:hypothetical protein